MITDDRVPSPSFTAPRRWARSVARSGLLLATPALLLLVFMFVVPVALLLARSILEPEPGLQNYAELLSSRAYRTILANTFQISLIVTVVTFVIGFPVAWLLAVIPRMWAAIIFGVVF